MVYFNVTNYFKFTNGKKIFTPYYLSEIVINRPEIKKNIQLITVHFKNLLKSYFSMNICIVIMLS